MPQLRLALAQVDAVWTRARAAEARVVVARVVEARGVEATDGTRAP